MPTFTIGVLSQNANFNHGQTATWYFHLFLVSAAVKDTSVNGLEGLNINWEAPFNFDKYVVGFRYHLGNLKKVPESLFAKRSIETTGVEGVATVDADYNINSKVISADAKWVAKGRDLEARAKANSEDRVTEIGLSTSQDVEGKKVLLSADYNLQKKKLAGSAKVTIDDTTAEVKYDNVDKDAVLKVSHKVDAKNTVEPSISLKSGHMTYGWTRAWNGGSVETVYNPGETVDVTWKDTGANGKSGMWWWMLYLFPILITTESYLCFMSWSNNIILPQLFLLFLLFFSGVWNTKASIPVDDHAATTVSFSRDWKY